MNKNKATRAFTLAEIMVWITIISILAIWITNMDFNRLSKKQELEIELVKITNIIEETKNNALIWRWVDNGSWLVTPDNWAVVIDTSWSWSIESIWSIWAWTWSLSSWQTKFPFEITNMLCQTTDGLTDDTSTDPIVFINYTWANAELVWCTTNSFKKLVFDFGFIGNTKKISINAVTGVMEKQ
jgi:Tfp pilus assembly protein FimT